MNSFGDPLERFSMLGLPTTASTSSRLHGLVSRSPSLVESLGRSSSPAAAIISSVGNLFNMAKTGFSDDSEMNSVLDGSLGDETSRAARNSVRDEKKVTSLLSESAQIATAILLCCL